MSFPGYPHYRDSGVEWLGNIPAHWHVRRLKRAASVLPSNVDKKTYDDGLPVRLCNYTDVYYNETITDALDFMTATATAEQVSKFTLRAGDTVITKDSEAADDIAVAAYVPADLPGVVCGYHLSIVRPTHGAYGAFVKRLFDSAYVKSSVEVRANGLTRVGLGQYALDNLVLPSPPLSDQRLISAFLDRETETIDALVAVHQQLIELLKEKRQTVISHVVTKGLNPQTPMKPSGIEWIGEVPKHWEVRRIKDDFDTCSGGTPDTAQQERYYADSWSGVPWIRTTDLQNDVLYSAEVYITERALEDTACAILPPGTVMIAMYGGDGTVGKNGILAIPAAINQAICGLLPSATVNSTFAFRFMQFYRPYWMIGAESSRKDPNISQERVRNAPFVRPPPPEQDAIVQFVESFLARTGELLREAERAVVLLEERRTALISAAVTGQIDVRSLVESAAA